MKQVTKKEFTKRDPVIKFVKVAGSWCKTSWTDGKQKQEWSLTKEGFNEQKQEIRQKD